MIILELNDGTIYKLNLPEGKGKKLCDMWEEHNNKYIAFTINGEQVNIKLSEIVDCYIGDKIKNNLDDISSNRLYGNNEEGLDFLKGLFGNFK